MNLSIAKAQLQLIQIRHQVAQARQKPALINDSQQDQSVDVNADEYIDKDEAIKAAIDHLEGDTTQSNIPESEQSEDAALVETLKTALTQKQRYPKIGGIEIAGIPIALENPEHSTREGVDQDGTPWSITMRDHYGYIEGIEGADGDELDCFLKPGTQPDWEGDIYVIEQNNPETGEFDEHKVMIGYDSQEEAEAAYMRNYAEGWQGFGDMITYSIDDFIEDAEDGTLIDDVELLDDADRWITVHPHGKYETGEKSGTPVLIGEDGTVKGGMGGKFNGKNIKDAHGTKEFTSHETNAETDFRNFQTQNDKRKEKLTDELAEIDKKSQEGFYTHEQEESSESQKDEEKWKEILERNKDQEWFKEAVRNLEKPLPKGTPNVFEKFDAHIKNGDIESAKEIAKEYKKTAHKDDGKAKYLETAIKNAETEARHAEKAESEKNTLTEPEKSPIMSPNLTQTGDKKMNAPTEPVTVSPATEGVTHAIPSAPADKQAQGIKILESLGYKLGEATDINNGQVKGVYPVINSDGKTIGHFGGRYSSLYKGSSKHSEEMEKLEADFNSVTNSNNKPEESQPQKPIKPKQQIEPDYSRVTFRDIKPSDLAGRDPNFQKRRGLSKVFEIKKSILKDHYKELAKVGVLFDSKTNTGFVKAEDEGKVKAILDKIALTDDKRNAKSHEKAVAKKKDSVASARTSHYEEEPDMPTRREDGSWYDAETGLEITNPKYMRSYL